MEIIRLLVVLVARLRSTKRVLYLIIVKAASAAGCLVVIERSCVLLPLVDGEKS